MEVSRQSVFSTTAKYFNPYPGHSRLKPLLLKGETCTLGVSLRNHRHDPSCLPSILIIGLPSCLTPRELVAPQGNRMRRFLCSVTAINFPPRWIPLQRDPLASHSTLHGHSKRSVLAYYSANTRASLTMDHAARSGSTVILI